MGVLKKYCVWQCDPEAGTVELERCSTEALAVLATELLEKTQRTLVVNVHLPPVEDSMDLAFLTNLQAHALKALLRSWESWKRDRKRLEQRPQKLSKLDAVPSEQDAHKCNGWNGAYYSDDSPLPGVANLFDVSVGQRNHADNHVGHGNISMSYLWDIGELSSKYPQHSSLTEFLANDPEAALAEYSKCELLSQQPNRVKEHLYHATGFSLRASRCIGPTQEGCSGMCKACFYLQLDESLYHRARDALKADGCHTRNVLKTNERHLKQNGKNEKCKHHQAIHQADRYTVVNLKQANQKLKQKLADALAASIKATEANDYPELLRNLIDAHELSKLDIGDKSSLLSQPLSDILTGISRCRLHGTRR